MTCQRQAHRRVLASCGWGVGWGEASDPPAAQTLTVKVLCPLRGPAAGHPHQLCLGRFGTNPGQRPAGQAQGRAHSTTSRGPEGRVAGGGAGSLCHSASVCTAHHPPDPRGGPPVALMGPDVCLSCGLRPLPPDPRPVPCPLRSLGSPHSEWGPRPPPSWQLSFAPFSLLSGGRAPGAASTSTVFGNMLDTELTSCQSRAGQGHTVRGVVTVTPH